MTPRVGLAIGVALELALFALSGAVGSLVATLLLGPLVVGLLAGPLETAAASGLAVALGLVAGAWHGNFDSLPFWVRLTVVALGGLLATAGAGARVRTAQTLKRFELLAAVGDVADGSRGLSETVERLLDLVVPEFADLCVLDAGTTPATLRRLGARTTGPRRAVVEEAMMRRKVVRDAPFGALRAARTSQSQLIAPVTPDQLRLIASDEADLDALIALNMSSALFVPLRSRGRVVGTLSCGAGPSGRHFDDDDLRFAEVLSGRIALALDNAGLTAELTSLERQLDATLTSLAEAVTIQDPDGRTVFVNRAAVELLRAPSAQDLLDTEPGEVMNRFLVTYEDGTPVTYGDLPGARAIAGEDPEPVLVRNVVKATGEERWLVNKATPVRDADGRVSLVVNVIEDVTEVKRAEYTQRLLADAGELLASSLDYETTLQQVAQLAVPELADWCGVNLPADDGVLRSVAVAHVDPEKVAMARQLGERYPARMDDPTGSAEVMRSGEPQVVNDISDEMLEQAAVDAEHLELLRDLGMRAAMIVPLTTGQHTLGVLALVEAESGRAFDEQDRALAQELARRAAVAVENARLYTERSAIARTLQQSLLPPVLPDVPGWELAGLYRAAGDENEVGGDFYDVFRVPSGWMVVVGDVAGRGAEAAALTSLARYTLRTAASLLDDPVAALTRLNDALRERGELSMVSVCCALLRERDDGRGEADVVCAGHPQPFLVPAAEQPRQVGHFAPFLGAFETAEWRPYRVTLTEGDQLILYTDGVIDTVGASDRFGEERLGRVVAAAAGPSDAVTRIEAALSEFERGTQRDDTAVLALRRTRPRARVAEVAAETARA